MAKTTDSESRTSGLPAASGVSVAAIIAQVAASGFTIKWRDVPNKA